MFECDSTVNDYSFLCQSSFQLSVLKPKPIESNFSGQTNTLLATRNFNKYGDPLHNMYVVISKPMADLCMTCPQNTKKLQRAASLSECEKVKCIRSHQVHINSVQFDILTDISSILCQDVKLKQHFPTFFVEKLNSSAL